MKNGKDMVRISVYKTPGSSEDNTTKTQQLNYPPSHSLPQKSQPTSSLQHQVRADRKPLSFT